MPARYDDARSRQQSRGTAAFAAATRRGPLRAFLAVALPAFAALSILACSESDPFGPVTDTGNIGPAGGTLSLAGDSVVLVFPPGAVTDAIEVSVTKTAFVPNSGLFVQGSAYRFEPSGEQFALPVEVTIQYDPAQRPTGVQADELRLSRVEGGAWQVIPGSTPAVEAVSGAVSSFSALGVVGVAVEEVSVAPTSATILIGATTQLGVAVMDGDGNELEQRAVSWSSSDELVATVDETGLVTGNGEGNAWIIAASEGQSDSSAVTVVPEQQETGEPVPLIDMGSSITYLGFTGGLYPGGSNDIPPAHAAAQPAVDTSQPFVMISIGMSNTRGEFEEFIEMAATVGNLHPNLRLINGAQGAQTAEYWTSPSDPTWDFVDDLMAHHPEGLTPDQVQVAWLKQANPHPTVSLPDSGADVFVLYGYLQQIVQAAKVRYPNLKQVYLSSRIWSCAPLGTLNPEPFAYESGFAAKWTVEESIAGDIPGAPWLAWGPYLWADGQNPRSDGLTWEIADFTEDCTHPNEQGRDKVGEMLIDFFTTSPLTTPWFLQSTSTTQVVVGSVSNALW